MNTMDELEQVALEFIGQLKAADYSGAWQRFDAPTAQSFPETRLKETWEQIPGQVGAFQRIVGRQAMERGENRMVTVTCAFEKAALDFFLVFNPEGKISKFGIQLAADSSAYRSPEYVIAGAFHEVEVIVGKGEWTLPGTLSVPEGAGPFPAVVLVHGSGPQDRDETIGPNKPFRDIAEGLSSRGIVVLRYEKRTKAHGAQFTPEIIAKLTVQEEVVDDALAAVQLLRGMPAIDPRRIYVLGHSLGGGVAPKIGQQDAGIAGLIVMAGMSRPLEDAILDQITYLSSLSGETTEAQKAEIEQLKVKVARAKDPALTADTPADELPLGISPAYLLDLRGYQPYAVARDLAMRVLVLQGGRDYQVTVKSDFPLWQKALEGKRNAMLKVYPQLMHLFIAGEGPSTPQEYLKEGHVSGEVVEDIARWIGEE
jgi:hypothetical protein